MSNKKYRTPAPDTDSEASSGADPVGDAPSPNPTATRSDSGADAAPEKPDMVGDPLPKPGERVLPASVYDLTNENARAMLIRAAHFLDMMIQTSIDLLNTVSIKGLRDAIDENMPLPEAMSEEDKRAWKAKEPQSEDPKKRPRGRRHPLLSLVSWTISACRLQIKTLTMLRPEMATKVATTYEALKERLKQYEQLVKTRPAHWD